MNNLASSGSPKVIWGQNHCWTTQLYLPRNSIMEQPWFEFRPKNLTRGEVRTTRHSKQSRNIVFQKYQVHVRWNNWRISHPPKSQLRHFHRKYIYLEHVVLSSFFIQDPVVLDPCNIVLKRLNIWHLLLCLSYDKQEGNVTFW